MDASSHGYSSDGVPIRAYLRVIARWKWLIIALTVLACGGAYAYSRLQTPMYRATAQLMYEPQLNVADLSSSSYVDPTQRAADLDSVATIVASSQLNSAVRQTLGQPSAPVGVSAQPQLASDNSGDLSNVVLVIGISSDAPLAAKAANAFAHAFVDWRRQRERQRLQQAADVVSNTLKSYTTPEAKATSEYLVLQQQLRNLEILKETATGNFSVITEAATPSGPYAPQPLRSAAFGFAGGLLLGLILAFVLEQFDTQVRSEEQVLQALPFPVLGRVPRFTKKQATNGDDPLVTLHEPTGPAAEAFRMLRSNLDFVNPDREVRSIMVTSSAQREGKSLTVCNLAVSLALSGKRVVLVDGDLRSPHVHLYLGLRNSTGLSTVLARNSRLSQVLMSVPLTSGASLGSLPSAKAVRKATPAGEVGEAGTPWQEVAADGTSPLFVLTSGLTPPNPGELIASPRLGGIIEELSDHADIVLVDAPAMLAVGDTATLASKVDGLVYLVDTNIARKPMLQRAAEQLAKLPCRKLGLIVMTDKPGDHYYYRHHARGAKPDSQPQKAADTRETSGASRSS